MDQDYQRLRILGKGGMSTVYLARHKTLKRLVAIKVLKTDTSYADKEYVRRFFREARITAQLEHPNIIRIYESNFGKGAFYIVTEYIDGGDFRKLLATGPRTDTRKNHTVQTVGLRTKIEIVDKVVQALHYAHEQGIVHRDIKPSNILLTKSLEPKLCDFGIATALWGQESRFTRTEEVMGTMDYIAPEQKESSKHADQRSDIYSMGVILYVAITGRKPEGAFPPPIKLVPVIPSLLNTVTMKCLQPVPSDRYKNANNLSLNLRQVIPQLTSTILPPLITSPPGTDDTGTLPPDSLPEELTEITTSPPPAGDNAVGNFFQYAENTLVDTQTIDSMLNTLKNGTLSAKLNIKPRFLDAVSPEHVEKLLAMLPDSDGIVKETLIEALEKIKSPKSCPDLIELLVDPYYNKLAAAAIGAIGCKEAEEKLFNILLARSEKSYIALVPLGKLNSARSIDMIAEYLSHKYTWVRELALEALGMIKDKKVIGFIESAANKDADTNIRAKAKKLLWRLKQ